MLEHVYAHIIETLSPILLANENDVKKKTTRNSHSKLHEHQMDIQCSYTSYTMPSKPMLY